MKTIEKRIVSCELSIAATIVHNRAVEKGFWDNPPQLGTALMLITSELGECIEADRKGMRADLSKFDSKISKGCSFEFAFGRDIKDTVEDELADAMIRILDLAGSMKIDIARHVNLKMAYNLGRSNKHGKNY